MHHVSNFENYTWTGLEFPPKMPQWTCLREIISVARVLPFLAFGPETLGPPKSKCTRT